MEVTDKLDQGTMAHTWAALHMAADDGPIPAPDAYRLAFTDPEFLLRREVRGIRMQLEMLKPDLEQTRQGINETIVVFGSARFVAPDVAQTLLQAAQASGDAEQLAVAQRQVRNAQHYENARLFARMVAQHSLQCAPAERLFICTGGGPGIMEAANRGAAEIGAPTTGLNITLPKEQKPNPYVTPSLSFKFHYFAMRKMHFMMRAKALVAFPGGFGTLDELFEVITLVQTQKAKRVPIVLFGTGYWQRLINMDLLIEEGTIAPQDLELLHYTDDVADAWQHIKAFYGMGAD